MQSCSRNAAGKGVFIFRNIEHSNSKGAVCYLSCMPSLQPSTLDVVPRVCSELSPVHRTHVCPHVTALFS